MEMIVTRHGKSLRTLQLQNTCEGWACDKTLNGLSTFHIADLELECSPAWVARIVAQNSSNLVSLKLGIESCIKSNPSDIVPPKLYTKELAHAIREESKSLLQSPDPGTELTFAQNAILKPTSVHLIGISLTDHAEIGVPPLFDFSHLQSLCLESCWSYRGSDMFSKLLTAPDSGENAFGAPQLRNFRLRHSGSNAAFLEYLKKFLASFTGLVHLAILLEGNGPWLHPNCFTKNHGQTLRTLVWHQRPHRQASMDSDTYTYNETFDSTHAFVKHVAAECPKLKELGVCLDLRKRYFRPYVSYHLQSIQ